MKGKINCWSNLFLLFVEGNAFNYAKYDDEIIEMEEKIVD